MYVELAVADVLEVEKAFILSNNKNHNYGSHQSTREMVEASTDGHPIKSDFFEELLGVKDH